MEIELAALNIGDVFTIGKQSDKAIAYKFYSQGIMKKTALSIVQKYKNGMILIEGGFETYALDSNIVKSLFVDKIS